MLMATTSVETAQRVDHEHRYLIIAGSYKAGTSSLFIYLERHPGVCASEQKETWFFSPPRLHPQEVPRYPDGLAPYLSYFPPADPARLRVEGTPFYLYSSETAEWIHQALPDSRIVVLLRDPVERLRSWYQMSTLYGWLEQPEGFDAYVNMLRQDTRPLEQRPTHLRGLEHGCYSPYLKEYFRVFGRERVLVIWLDELESNPHRSMRRLCSFAGLDAGFYDSYPFAVHHNAIEVKHEKLYQFYISAKNLLGRVQPLRRPLRKLRLATDRSLYPFFFRPAKKIGIASETERFLRQYYAADAEELQMLLREPVPWAAAKAEMEEWPEAVPETG